MTMANGLERLTFTFSVWAATSSTCWPGPGCSGKDGVGSLFSLEHEALVNGELLSTEKVLSPNGGHANWSLEGDGSEVCTEDPDYLERAGGEDHWRSEVVREDPGSLELANGGLLKRRAWSCYRRWGGGLNCGLCCCGSFQPPPPPQFTSCRASLFLLRTT